LRCLSARGVSSLPFYLVSPSLLSFPRSAVVSSLTRRISGLRLSLVSENHPDAFILGPLCDNYGLFYSPWCSVRLHPPPPVLALCSPGDSIFRFIGMAGGSS
jgi:hypothetical protein